MKTIYHVFLLIALFSFGLSLLALPAMAASDPGSSLDIVQQGIKTTADQAKLDTSEQNDLPTLIGRAINYLLGIVGVIFLTVTLIGGYMWMTAGGSEEKVGKAKKMIENGINGMIVIFLAYALVYVILVALGGATQGTQTPR